MVASLRAEIAVPMLGTAGAGIKVVSAVQKLKQDKVWGKFQKRQGLADAFAQLGAAKVQSDKIRRQTQQAAKGKTTDLANSGVVVGSGTGDEAVRDLLESGYYDANITMYNAHDAFMRALQNVKYNDIKAKQQNTADRWAMASSLMGFAGSALDTIDKWQKASASSSNKAAVTNNTAAANDNKSSFMSSASSMLKIADAGLGIISSVQKLKQDKVWGKFQKRQGQADAFAQLGVAKVQANKIRQQTQQAAKNKTAELANAGVVVGSGTGDEAVRDLLESGYYDANITMYNAYDSFMKALQNVKYNAIKAKQQNTANKWAVASSLLNFGSTAMS